VSTSIKTPIARNTVYGILLKIVQKHTNIGPFLLFFVEYCLLLQKIFHSFIKNLSKMMAVDVIKTEDWAS
jgi:hypothetical protein